MCVAIVKPAGVSIDERKLRNCFAVNSDGAGYAVQREGGIFLKKGFFNVEEFINSVRENVIAETPALLHCRIATHGLRDAGNTHPFIISKEVELLRQTEGEFDNFAVMIHNGVFSKAIPAFTEKILSDSQEFIRKFLSDDYVIEALWENSIIREFFEDFISTNKIAIMHPKRGVIYFGKFIESDGVLYSNNSYEERKLYYYEKENLGRYSEQNLPLVTRKTGYCYWCERYTEDLKTLLKVPLCQECYKTITTIQRGANA